MNLLSKLNQKLKMTKCITSLVLACGMITGTIALAACNTNQSNPGTNATQPGGTTNPDEITPPPAKSKSIKI